MPIRAKTLSIVALLALSAAASDARAQDKEAKVLGAVMHVKDQVELTTKDVRLAKVADQLFRGNRLTTRAGSAAEILLHDGTRIQIGPSSQVIVAGESQMRLVGGRARAQARALELLTDSAAVAVNDSEAQVSADEYRTTRLAVYRGASSITAQKKTVEVPEGFGSKVLAGRPPSVPSPLPAAPAWEAKLPGVVLAHAPADLSLPYALPDAPSGSSASEWHVQLARDPKFGDLLLDARSPLEVRRIEAKGLSPGSYFARVSALDADGFEGKWSAVARTTVARIGVEQQAGRRARLTLEPAGLACTLDGTPTSWPIAIDRDRDHTVACDAGGGAPGTLLIPMQPIGRARVTAEPVRIDGRSGMLRVVVFDEAGSPVGRLTPVAEAPAELQVGQLRASGAAGVYIAPFTWSAEPRPTSLRIRVKDGLVAETNVVRFTSDHPADAPTSESPSRRARLELAVAGALGYRGRPPVGLGFDVEARAAVPSGSGAVLVGASGGLLQLLPAELPPDGPAGATRDVRIVGSTFGGRPFVGYRFGHGRIAPYVTLGPELLRQWVAAGFEDGRREGREWLVGGSGGAGVEVEAGPGGFFLEARGRLVTPVTTEEPSLTASGLLVLFGYRVRP